MPASTNLQLLEILVAEFRGRSRTVFTHLRMQEAGSWRLGEDKYVGSRGQVGQVGRGTVVVY